MMKYRKSHFFLVFFVIAMMVLGGFTGVSAATIGEADPCLAESAVSADSTCVSSENSFSDFKQRVADKKQSMFDRFNRTPIQMPDCCLPCPVEPPQCTCPCPVEPPQCTCPCPVEPPQCTCPCPITCPIKGKLEVTKKVEGTPPQEDLEYVVKITGDCFSKTFTIKEDESKLFFLDPGSYTIIETESHGAEVSYSQSSFDIKSCSKTEVTITNTFPAAPAKGTLKLTKLVVGTPPDGADYYEAVVSEKDGPPVWSFVFPDWHLVPDQPRYVDLDPGTYTIEETLTHGADVSYSAGEFTILAGQTTVVTITNTFTAAPAKGTLKLTKLVVGTPPDGADYYEAVVSEKDGPPVWSFVFPDWHLLPDQPRYVDLDPGTYTIEETLTHGADVSYSAGEFTIVAGQTTEVTITNTFTAAPAQVFIIVEKSANRETASEGDEIIFTLSVTNTGPGDATNVVVNDGLPSGLTYVSHSGDGTYDPTTGNWTVASLPKGASASLDITVTVDEEASGTITNTATLIAVDQDNTNPDTGAETDVEIVDPNGCQGETAYGGNTAGAGAAWWYYFDTQGPQTQTIWAGQTLNAGTVTITPENGTVRIEMVLNPGWQLRNVSESVKIQGYNEGQLPSSRPAMPPQTFNTYRGESLVITGLPSFRYYVIHLDVEFCGNNNTTSIAPVNTSDGEAVQVSTRDRFTTLKNSMSTRFSR